ncbi:hypothetical protein ABZP36_033387 [Zizania latifolia]
MRPSLAAGVLLVLVVAAAAATPAPAPIAPSGDIVKTLCAKTDYPVECQMSVVPKPGQKLDAAGVLRLAMDVVRAKAADAKKAAGTLIADPKTARLALSPLHACVDLYDYSSDSLDQADKAISAGDKNTTATMLDSVLTYVDTCDQGFVDLHVTPLLSKQDEELAKLATMCIDIATAVAMPAPITPGGDIVKTLCSKTDYPVECQMSVVPKPGQKLDAAGVLRLAMDVVRAKAADAKKAAGTLIADPKTARLALSPLHACVDLYDYISYSLDRADKAMAACDKDTTVTMLDAVLSDVDTCDQSFEDLHLTPLLSKQDEELAKLATICIDITKTLRAKTDYPVECQTSVVPKPGQKLDAARVLLLASPGSPEFKPNVTVTADGSGDFKTINEALAKVSLMSTSTYVMYVKAGTYKEYVSVASNLTNLVMIGDGATKTIITGNKSVMMNLTTMYTATMEVIGDGFFMRGIGVENTAGAKNYQAVALRVHSDQSVFYECQFDGYQDTLYAQINRQYYRDCTITGTIDFIFGDSKVVFQNCLIQVRRCMDNQQNVVTAQGRESKSDFSGTVIHNCTIEPHPEFKADADKFRTFLGRPWKEYSRTLYIQSDIGSFIDPLGWLPWLGDFGLNTCYYAEVENRGAGADISKRAKWGGIRVVTYQQTQLQYTVETFIQGHQWIPKFDVPFIPGLIPH